MIFNSVEEVKALKEKMYESADAAYEKIKNTIDSCSPLDLLFEMKFNKIGFDPVEGTELNLIEQINQLFSDLVAMYALEDLFLKYPDKAFKTHLGSEPGFDIESLDGDVVAECFAVTTASSNGKLKKDSEKLLLKAIKPEKNIYFYSQNDTDEKLGRVYEKFPEISYVRIKNFK